MGSCIFIRTIRSIKKIKKFPSLKNGQRKINLVEIISKKYLRRQKRKFLLSDLKKIYCSPNSVTECRNIGIVSDNKKKDIFLFFFIIFHFVIFSYHLSWSIFTSLFSALFSYFFKWFRLHLISDFLKNLFLFFCSNILFTFSFLNVHLSIKVIFAAKYACFSLRTNYHTKENNYKIYFSSVSHNKTEGKEIDEKIKCSFFYLFSIIF